MRLTELFSLLEKAKITTPVGAAINRSNSSLTEIFLVFANMLSVLNSLGLLLLVVSLSQILLAQDGSSSITLNKNSVEALMSSLTPNCRMGLEAAMGAQAQLSDECKEEIQSMLIAAQQKGGKLDGEPAAAAPVGTGAGTGSATGNARTITNPAIAIAGFIALLFAGIGALVVYMNSVRSAGVTPKSKKISKKKVNYC